MSETLTDRVDTVATLARLQLDEAERAALKNDLGNIVELVNQLTVDVSTVSAQPSTSAMKTRPDVAGSRPVTGQSAYVALSPEPEDGYYRVPQILAS